MFKFILSFLCPSTGRRTEKPYDNFIFANDAKDIHNRLNPGTASVRRENA